MTTETNLKSSTITTTREGNTFYAFADSGEMVGSSGGSKSLLCEVADHFRAAGIAEFSYNGQTIKTSDVTWF